MYSNIFAIPLHVLQVALIASIFYYAAQKKGLFATTAPTGTPTLKPSLPPSFQPTGGPTDAPTPGAG